jgi:hypothetical protein
MFSMRKSCERGGTRLDWLDSRHTFPFGEYYDPAAMGFSVLAWRPARAFRRIRIATWRSYPGCCLARWSTATLGNGSIIRVRTARSPGPLGRALLVSRAGPPSLLTRSSDFSRGSEQLPRSGQRSRLRSQVIHGP